MGLIQVDEQWMINNNKSRDFHQSPKYLHHQQKMQSPLKFYKAKLHAYSKISSKKCYHHQVENIYRFCSQRPRTQEKTRSCSRKEKLNDQLIKFNHQEVMLSVWNLLSNQVELKEKRRKVLNKPKASLDAKSSKIPSNYLARMQLKRKIHQNNFVINSNLQKNVNEIQVNRLNPIYLAKNDKLLKNTCNQSAISYQRKAKHNLPTAFSQRLKECKVSLGSLQARNLNLSEQKGRFQSQTLNISDLCQKNSLSIFTQSKFNKTLIKMNIDENLQAWTDRSHRNDEIQIHLVSRRKSPTRTKSKSFRLKHSKSFAQ